MTQTERIEHYERVLDAVTAAEEKLENALEDFAAAGPLLRELESYYGSEDWRKDFEDDEKGLLPKSLKRGVLSEDAAYDALTDERRLLIMMLETAAQALRG